MATDNAKINKAGTMRKVLSYMKRYIPLLVISLALSVVTVALTLYFPILTGRAIDLIVGKGKVDFPSTFQVGETGRRTAQQSLKPASDLPGRLV